MRKKQKTEKIYIERKSRFSFKKLIVYTGIACCLFAFGYFYSQNRYNNLNSRTIDYSEKEPNWFEKNFDQHARLVTKTEVESKLHEAGELVSMKSDYVVEKSVEDTRKIFERYNIPFTTNVISMKCPGSVKVAYNLENTQVEVNNLTQTISIALGDQIVYNDIDLDKIEHQEQNNFFNKIRYEQYEELFKEIKETGLQEAEDENIYEKAETKAQDLIQNMFSDLEGYTVVFTNA